LIERGQETVSLKFEIFGFILIQSKLKNRKSKIPVRIIALILGLALAAWGGVIAYRALFLEPSMTAIINTSTGALHEYPNMLRVTLGLIMLIGGACIAFFAARRKPS
jgi:hypothetical protein